VVGEAALRWEFLVLKNQLATQPYGPTPCNSVLFETLFGLFEICPESDSFGPEAKLRSFLLARNVPHASKTVWRYSYVILERILLRRSS
jgi:hypothetical protein